MNLEYGELISSEKRDLKQARRKLYFIGFSLYFLMTIPILIGMVISYLAMFILLIFVSLWLYDATTAIIRARMGVKNLQVYDNGFIRPQTHTLSDNIRGCFFIPFDAIKCIFTNPTLRKMVKWGYITVIMKDEKSSFAIDTRDIVMLRKFILTMKSNVKIVERDLLIGKYYKKFVDYYPPETTMIISSKGLSLRYKDQIKEIGFNEIRRIRLHGPWLIQLKEGNYRISFFRLPEKQVLRLKEAFQKFRKEGA